MVIVIVRNIAEKCIAYINVFNDAMGQFTGISIIGEKDDLIISLCIATYVVRRMVKRDDQYKCVL